MPKTLSSDTEYLALTNACAIVDRSARGKLALTGGDAKGFLQGQLTNDVEGLSPGEGCYAAYLTNKGKMLGDVRVLDRGDELALDTERVALQELFNLIRRFKIGYDVELHKRTLERGLLSVIGPAARTVTGAEDLPATEHAHRPGELDGVVVQRIVTDLGIDIECDAADTTRVAAALRERGAEPVSEGAADIVRVESGRPRYGIDLDDSVIPQEAGLNERAVSFTKGCYVGQETVARLFYRGKPNRRLRGLRLSAPAAPGDELRRGEKVVGRLGSCAVSPRRGPIALAIVRREAEPGSVLAVGDGETTGEVVELPFSG